MLGHFVRNSQNDSMGVGAGNVTFFPNTPLPLFDLTGRGGIRPARQLQITQPQQLWFNKATNLIGLPGVVNSQFAFQPLLDYRNGVNGQ